MRLEHHVAPPSFFLLSNISFTKSKHSCKPVSVYTSTPCRRNTPCIYRCIGDSLPPSFFSSTKYIRPSGVITILSGTPTVDGDTNFINSPPCALMASFIFFSISDSVNPKSPPLMVLTLPRARVIFNFLFFYPYTHYIFIFSLFSKKVLTVLTR